MQIGEAVAIPELLDIEDECPFDHDLEEPPKVMNVLIGKGGTLASRMKHGRSTNRYGPYKPEDPLEKIVLPQKRNGHPFYKQSGNKGRSIDIVFKNGVTKNYPCSCSAHHLVPSQESLKNHDLLEYMCKEGSAAKHNHGYSQGAVWSDVGYDTNGCENGICLPGSYAVGGGRSGLKVWYSTVSDPEKEHSLPGDEPLPLEEHYKGYLLSGERGLISRDNPCWRYVAQAVKMAPGQFHDRHVAYSEDVVKSALSAIHEKYSFYDITLASEACDKCKEKKKKIEEKGLPAPYGVVNRLRALSRNLAAFLSGKPGFWRPNIFTSEWGKRYMLAVLDEGEARKAAEMYED